jgi:poly(A) polymerase
MFGVTPPISTEVPKPTDIKASEGMSCVSCLCAASSPPMDFGSIFATRRVHKLTHGPALMADLIALNQFESDAERKVRERLLSNIAQLVSKFVHDVSIKSGLSEKVASEAGGRIYTSGSYRWVRASNDSILDHNESPEEVD